MPPLKAGVISAEHLRRAVLQGVGHDYLGGPGGPAQLRAMSAAGSAEAARRARPSRARAGLPAALRQPFTAQALTDLAAPVSARCGGRRFVPMLIEASMASAPGTCPLWASAPGSPTVRTSASPAAARTPLGCDRVGIDLVLRREASAVTAGRRPRARPADPRAACGRPRPGLGRLPEPGRPRGRESPFHVVSNGGSRSPWAGIPAGLRAGPTRIAYPGQAVDRHATRARSVRGGDEARPDSRRPRDGRAGGRRPARRGLGSGSGSSLRAFFSERDSFKGRPPPGRQ